MKITSFLPLTVVSSLFVFTSDLPAFQKDSDYDILFDGTTKSAKNFRSYDSPAISHRWQIEGDSLVFMGNGSSEMSRQDLMTKRTYRDFELLFEWKISERGNSGVLYRVVRGQSNPSVSALEYQIMDDWNHPAARKTPAKSAASLYALYAPENKKLKPTGQWNSAKIVVSGNIIEHWLNGEKVVHAVVGSADWRHRLNGAKVPKWKKFGSATAGHICFQDHGNKVWYRNIRIRRL